MDIESLGYALDALKVATQGVAHALTAPKTQNFHQPTLLKRLVELQEIDADLQAHITVLVAQISEQAISRDKDDAPPIDSGSHVAVVKPGKPKPIFQWSEFLPVALARIADRRLELEDGEFERLEDTYERELPLIIPMTASSKPLAAGAKSLGIDLKEFTQEKETAPKVEIKEKK